MNIEELKKDLAELKELSGKATRKRVQDVLTIAQHKIETDIVNLEAQFKKDQAAAAAVSSASKPASDKRYIVDLNEYAWDQSDKFIKIFATLDGVQKLTESDVQTEFTPNSMVVTVKNLNNRDYRLTIKNLMHPIDLAKSYHKIKTDMVAIYMKKEKEAVKWSHLTLTEKRLHDMKDASFKANDDELKDDPSAGMMKIMQKMYETGDSETKRMIAKAWQEGQDKARKEPGML